MPGREEKLKLGHNFSVDLRLHTHLKVMF